MADSVIEFFTAIYKAWSLTKNKPVTPGSYKQTPLLTLSLSFTVKVWSFTKSRLRHRLLHCYLYKDLKIYENQTTSQTTKIFSKLNTKRLEWHSWRSGSGFFVVDFGHVFVCWDIFKCSNFEEFLKVTLFIRSTIFKGIYAKVPS